MNKYYFFKDKSGEGTTSVPPIKWISNLKEFVVYDHVMLPEGSIESIIGEDIEEGEFVEWDIEEGGIVKTSRSLPNEEVDPLIGHLTHIIEEIEKRAHLESIQ